MKYFQLTIFAVLSLLYGYHATQAGALGADEVCAVGLARLPLAQLPHWLIYDSYPIVWPLVVKLWMTIFGPSDASFRLLGLVVMLALSASVFFCARAFKVFPWATVALFLFTPLCIVHCSELRAWGLGCATMFLAMGQIKRAANGKASWILATLGAVAAVQTSYYNSLILFAYIVPSLIWHPKACKGAFLTGLIAAASLLPYVPLFLGEHDHYAGLKVHFGWGDFWPHILEAVWTGSWLSIYAWAVLICWLPFICTRYLCWSLARIAIALAVYFSFLHQLSYCTQVWYYLPLIGFSAMCLDMVINDYGVAIRLWFFACLVAFAPACLQAASEMPSSSPAAIALLNRITTDKDLIVVLPWAEGRHMQYYYHGAARWITVPSVADQFVTRYDLENRKMKVPPWVNVSFAEEDMQMTLDYFHGRIFVLSNIDWRSRHGATFEQILAAYPNLPANFCYETAVNEQFGEYVQTHFWKVIGYDLPGGRVSPFEQNNLAEVIK